MYPTASALFRSLCISIASLSVISCSAPGAPSIRESQGDGNGPIVPGCQNIVLDSRILRYQIGSYMSTWSSAWREGTQSGLQSGLEVKEGDRSRIRFTKKLSSSVTERALGSDGSDLPFLPFCMHIDAPRGKVSKAVVKLLPYLQNPIIRRMEKFGSYETDFFEREHSAAKWRDRYLIDLRSTQTGTDVFVYRDLWISRQGSQFVRAESNGGNEAWVLQQIRASLP